jgi:hypothetical protein
MATQTSSFYIWLNLRSIIDGNLIMILKISAHVYQQWQIWYESGHSNRLTTKVLLYLRRLVGSTQRVRPPRCMIWHCLVITWMAHVANSIAWLFPTNSFFIENSLILQICIPPGKIPVLINNLVLHAWLLQNSPCSDWEEPGLYSETGQAGKVGQTGEAQAHDDLRNHELATSNFQLSSILSVWSFVKLKITWGSLT